MLFVLSTTNGGFDGGAVGHGRVSRGPRHNISGCWGFKLTNPLSNAIIPKA